MVGRKKSEPVKLKRSRPGDVVSLLVANFTSKEFNRMVSRSGIPAMDKRNLCISFAALKN